MSWLFLTAIAPERASYSPLLPLGIILAVLMAFLQCAGSTTDAPAARPPGTVASRPMPACRIPRKGSAADQADWPFFKVERTQPRLSTRARSTSKVEDRCGTG